VPLACRGPADSPVWANDAQAERLLATPPGRNLGSTAIEQQLDLLLSVLPGFREAGRTGGRVTVEPVLPVDILGAYVLLPMPSGAGGLSG